MQIKQDKGLNFYLIGLIITIVLLTIFVFYQLFIDAQNHRIPLSQFFRSDNLKKAIAALKPAKLEPNTEAIYWIEQKQLFRNLSNPQLIMELGDLQVMSPIYENSNKDRIAFLTNDKKLYIVDMVNHLNKIIDLSPWMKAQIIHWDQNGGKIYLALKNELWEIASVESGELKTIVNNINYASEKLTNTYNPITGFIVYPRCEPSCYFQILNTNTLRIDKEIPAMTEGNADNLLSQLQLEFFDIESIANGLIGYEKTGSDFGKDFYVVDLKPDLLQAIQLLLNGNTQINFHGYIPKTQQMMFSSSHNPSGKQDIFLYAANKPTLSIVNTFDDEQKVSYLDIMGNYCIGDMVFNIDSKKYIYQFGDYQKLVYSR